MPRHPMIDMFARTHIGMRTFKTGISVFLTLFIYHTVLKTSPMIAAIATVFSQRTNLKESQKFGWLRVTGTTVGALMALVTLFFTETLPKTSFVDSIIPSLAVILIIVVCNTIKQPSIVISGVAVFMIIYFSIPPTDKYHYALNRILDTFIGSAVAILVEWLLPRERTTQWFQKCSKYSQRNKDNNED